MFLNILEAKWNTKNAARIFTEEWFSRAAKFRDLITEAQIEARVDGNWMYLSGEDFSFMTGIMFILHEGARLFILEQPSESGTFNILSDIRFLLHWQAAITEWNIGSEGYFNSNTLDERQLLELDGKFVKPYLATPVVLGKEEEVKCPICLDNILKEEDPMILPCGHIFGDQCLDRWVRAGDEQGCPMCRDSWDEVTHQFPFL
jgi:hypothetical protein